MALFRRLGRLHQLRDFSTSGKGFLFLAPVERIALQDSKRTLQRGVSTGFLQQRLASDFFLLTRSAAVLSTPCRCLYTQSGGSLAANVNEKQPTSGSASSKSRKHEHGSVLQELMTVKEEEQPKQLTVGAKVVRASKDFTYLLVVLGGFAVAGFLLWSVGSEFFSFNSPQTLYAKALKRVKQDPQVVETLGEPISGHGELTGRGRRREPLHQEYIVDGMQYMRMKFYVDGSKRKGTVHLDMKKNESGKYVCRFLFVELKGYPPGTIIIEDNR